MEVTKSNFKDLFPQIKQAIEECNFLAIDTEFTGLTTGLRKEHAFDTMEERYWKQYESCKEFLIIQFGLSCFTYHKDTKKYTHRDFNFYIFPRQHVRHAPDTAFVCQPSSIHFLSNFGFNFNKVFTEGISYLMPHDEERLSSILKTKHEQENIQKAPDKNGVAKDQKQRLVHIPEDQEDFIKNIHKQIDAFVSNASDKTLNLPPCNGYQRKLIYQTIEQKSLDGLELKTCWDDKHHSYIAVTKATDEEKLEKLQLKQVADIGELEDAVGFRKVMDVISESKKLVIGHNMLLDILHTVHQFFYPLPEDLREFKDLVKCLFPRVLDTKLLSSSSAFKDILPSTALPEVLAEMKNEKYKAVIEPANSDNCYDVNNEKLHEAGYDAFITGYCFIKLATALGTSRDFVSADSECLNPYINKLHVMRHFDVCSLNLRGPDPEPKRDHVFFASFPKEWKTHDLVELFSAYGGIYVSWLSDTSAFIALKSPEQTVNVKRVLSKKCSNMYKIQTFAEYQEAQLKYKFKAPDGDGKNHSDEYELPSKRRRSSGGPESVTNRIIDTIPEEEEIENNTTVSTSHSDSSNSSEKNKASYSEKPKTKKQKIVHEDGETDEVTSTEKIFDEPATW